MPPCVPKEDPISVSTSELSSFEDRQLGIRVDLCSTFFRVDLPRSCHADAIDFQSLRLTEDVLKRLHQMSSESLAANGESIRHKVLFIASSLLNKYPAQDSAGHEHVADFLQGQFIQHMA
jgi:hypothetical protein